MPHPLQTTQPHLAAAVSNIPQQRVKVVGWALLKEEVSANSGSAISPLYASLANNSDDPSSEEVQQAWAEVEQLERDGMALRAILEGKVQTPQGSLTPSTNTYIEHVQATRKLAAFVSLFQEPRQDRLLDIVQHLLNAGVPPEKISERLEKAPK